MMSAQRHLRMVAVGSGEAVAWCKNTFIDVDDARERDDARTFANEKAELCWHCSISGGAHNKKILPHMPYGLGQG